MSKSMPKEYNLKQLRWQCRRGIKEVEVILGPFFERHFEVLEPELQQAFVALLDAPDADLFEWLTQKNYPEGGPLYSIFEKIFSTLGPGAG